MINSIIFGRTTKREINSRVFSMVSRRLEPAPSAPLNVRLPVPPPDTKVVLSLPTHDIHSFCFCPIYLPFGCFEYLDFPLWPNKTQHHGLKAGYRSFYGTRNSFDLIEAKTGHWPHYNQYYLKNRPNMIGLSGFLST